LQKKYICNKLYTMNTKYFFGHPYFHLNLKLNNTLIQSLSKKAISLKKKILENQLVILEGFTQKYLL